MRTMAGRPGRWSGRRTADPSRLLLASSLVIGALVVAAPVLAVFTLTTGTSGWTFTSTGWGPGKAGAVTITPAPSNAPVAAAAAVVVTETPALDPSASPAPAAGSTAIGDRPATRAERARSQRRDHAGRTERRRHDRRAARDPVGGRP